MVLRSHRLALGCILLTALMDSVGFGIILPVLPELIMEPTGGGLSQAARYGGWLMFAFGNMLFGMLVLPETLKQEHRRPFDVRRANPLGTLTYGEVKPSCLFGMNSRSRPLKSWR